MQGGDFPEERLDAAFETIWLHRVAHQYPLTKATMGLRSMVKTERCQVEVSQRLKRLPTIVNKMLREPTLQLGNMQDIAGCRAVVGTIDEVRRVQRRMQANDRANRISDYIASPRASGYRGVHVIAEYDGREIEVQLRTRAQHEWAIAVERLGGRGGYDLKSGEGPPEVLALMSAISSAIALEEVGERVDDELRSKIEALRKGAMHLLGGRA